MSQELTEQEIEAMLHPTVDHVFSEQTIIDVMGEIGNIAMSQAATTLSSLLNCRVMITTPKVEKLTFNQVMQESTTPVVATSVEFKEGLYGANLMLLKVQDAVVIADLMMGNDGHDPNETVSEIELSAISEAMNQMIGSAATAMSSLIKKRIDIKPAQVAIWEESQPQISEAIEPTEDVYQISFSLSIDGLIDSQIMQIFNEEIVQEILRAVLKDNTVAKKEVPPVNENREQPRQETEPQIEIQQPEFQKLDLNTSLEGNNLDLILDVPLELSVVLGRTKRSIKNILNMSSGSVIELDHLTDEPLEILLNGKLIARGEVVVINENFGVRITDILSQKQRIYNLNEQEKS